MPNIPGIFNRIALAIGNAGGEIDAVDLVRVVKGVMVRDITVNARDEAHEKEIIESVKSLEEVKLVHVSDKTFQLHHGGKIEIHSKVPVRNRNDLSMVYTPGVARVCMAINQDKDKTYRFTIKRNSVAVVTDGSAVLGLGDIGPEAAMPVMEGKSMLFKEFAGIDAFPLALSTRDADEIIKTIHYLSPAFGAINLEDISAPRCFEIEEKLQEILDIPVFHDDQHGTAAIVLAALMNAARVVGKPLEGVRIVISGAGAAGTACCKMLIQAGVQDIIVCDRAGTIYQGRRENMAPRKEWIAAHTNRLMMKGNLYDAMRGADVFIGVSSPNLITAHAIKRMASDPIVFALANPVPEIAPEEAFPHARILATGRSDYPNQINNVLCFPGLFRGLLDSRARSINDEMKLAAAVAIASLVDEKELSDDYIVPSIFDRRVVTEVAARVADAARRTGVARK